MMDKTELLHGYLILGILLFIIAFTISIITCSNLGTSPILSIPYMASHNTPPSPSSFFFVLTVVLLCPHTIDIE